MLLTVFSRAVPGSSLSSRHPVFDSEKLVVAHVTVIWSLLVLTLAETLPIER